MMAKFPQEIQDFANTFVALQSTRHTADYDPDDKYGKAGVATDVSAATAAIKKFAAVGLKDRRAFAVWVLWKSQSRQHR
jgi:hypothetical protein